MPCSTDARSHASFISGRSPALGSACGRCRGYPVQRAGQAGCDTVGIDGETAQKDAHIELRPAEQLN